MLGSRLSRTVFLLSIGLLAAAASGWAQTNLALNRPVTASSTENAGSGANLAVDGNAGTRWSSAFTDPQWIYVDLGATYTVTRVTLVWEAAYGKAYQIQVSTNASTWTSIYSTTAGDGGTDDLTGLIGSGRYVRMYGTARATQYGYSLWELQVYGTSGATPTSTARPTATATTARATATATAARATATATSSSTTNLALNRPATASSTENAGTTANLAVDGNAGTRWSSAATDPQWIFVDLGTASAIGRVVLNWEAAYATAYQIQTSNDAATWTSIYSTTTSTGGVQTLTVSGNGRYVRMNGTARATQFGYSLWEFEVYGSGGATPTSTSRATATATTATRATATPTATATPRATATASGVAANIALNHMAFSSSDESAGVAANFAVDGNATTRWGSTFSDPQWIYVDLGASASITKVVLNWEAAYAKSFQIQTSSDSATWTSIYSTTTSAGGVQTLNITGSGRYVRMFGTLRSTAYGYSLWEFEVWGTGGAPAPTPPGRVTPKPLAATQWDAQVTSLMSQMSQAEKVAQTNGGSATFDTPDNTRLGIPGFHMSDGPHGIRGGTLWPDLSGAACSFDTALEQQVGTAMGQEFRSLGKNVSLGPMVDVVRDGRWGRANETYSEDPFLNGTLGAARVRGIQSAGVIPVVKHYTAYYVEQGRGNNPIQASERSLREIYVQPFQRAIAGGGPLGIMAAYNAVNGWAMTANNHLLTGVLKNDLSFQGWVVSDWGAIYNALDAAWGGTDIEMPGSAAFGQLGTFVANGQLPQSILDDKVRRILTSKYANGMMAAGYNATAFTGVVNTPAQNAIARTAAQKSLVLAKNNGNILPLSKTATQTIAVIGDYATICRNDGGGSGSLNGPYCVTPLQGIQSKVASNVTITTNWQTANWVIVVVGINDLGEAFDRTNLDLPNGPTCNCSQNALVAQVLAAKPNNTIVVYTGGSFTIGGSWSSAPAVVVALYPGQEQGNALADVLFGDYNPGGRLSVTFPADASQVPAWPTTTVEPAGEGRGYFYYDKHNLTPLFPFGHGLSYTTYAYTNLRISPTSVTAGQTVTVMVDVQNTGTRAGEEVVQLYVHDQVASVDRRVKDLRGFQRVALTAGQTKTLTFTLTSSDLAFWNDTTGSWLAEPGAFDVLIGASSRDIRLQGTFTLN
jgi:beta-glucosidase